MPNIAKKSKVFLGKGVVLSFTRDPYVFLYRELIPGTKMCSYEVIDWANTLEAIINNSLNVHNSLRSEILKDVQKWLSRICLGQRKSVLESASITFLLRSKIR